MHALHAAAAIQLRETTVGDDNFCEAVVGNLKLPRVCVTDKRAKRTTIAKKRRTLDSEG